MAASSERDRACADGTTLMPLELYVFNSDDQSFGTIYQAQVDDPIANTVVARFQLPLYGSEGAEKITGSKRTAQPPCEPQHSRAKEPFRPRGAAPCFCARAGGAPAPLPPSARRGAVVSPRAS